LGKITKEDIEKIRQIVEKEFPNDPALQQVHISRKIIAKEAELEGMSFLEYVKSQRIKQKQTINNDCKQL
jgi:hypothetical protein